MTILDTKLCCATTIGDTFKLILPVGWGIVALCACLAYLTAPLARGDAPRWGSVVLVLFNAVCAFGCSASIYSFHRSTSAYSVDWTEEQLLQRRQRLQIHWRLSCIFGVLSVVLLLFFATIASQLGLCAHLSCGADVGWSAITLCFTGAWIGVTYLGQRALSTTTSDEPKSGSDAVGDVEMP